MNYSTLAVITSSLALAMSGWFASGISSANGRINLVESAQAATKQQAEDIDARLTRIETKLDNLIQTKTSQR